MADIRRSLVITLQSQDVEFEKSARGRTGTCGLTKAHHGRKSRLLVAHADEVRVSRVYRCCVKCQVVGYALDGRLGIDGRYCPQTRRLISLAGASWYYDLSIAYLLDFCGLLLNDTTIREFAQGTGARMLKW